MQSPTLEVFAHSAYYNNPNGTLESESRAATPTSFFNSHRDGADDDGDDNDDNGDNEDEEADDMATLVRELEAVSRTATSVGSDHTLSTSDHTLSTAGHALSTNGHESYSLLQQSAPMQLDTTGFSAVVAAIGMHGSIRHTSNV